MAQAFWRPEFIAALEAFARISTDLDEQGIRPPILVGGAAVELYTEGAVATGDFDVVTAQQEAFEAVLRTHGFHRPSGVGQALRGWIHDDLKLGFEVVGARLLDGLADVGLVQIIEIAPAGTIAVIAIEDLIADRMGQFASGTAPEMGVQARVLYRLSGGLAGALDHAYMERRLREETGGTHGVQDLDDPA